MFDVQYIVFGCQTVPVLKFIKYIFLVFLMDWQDCIALCCLHWDTDSYCALLLLRYRLLHDSGPLLQAATGCYRLLQLSTQQLQINIYKGDFSHGTTTTGSTLHYLPIFFFADEQRRQIATPHRQLRVVSFFILLNLF